MFGRIVIQSDARAKGYFKTVFFCDNKNVLVSCRGRKGPKKEESIFKGNNKQTKQARVALCQAQNLVLLGLILLGFVIE